MMNTPLTEDIELIRTDNSQSRLIPSLFPYTLIQQMHTHCQIERSPFPERKKEIVNKHQLEKTKQRIVLQGDTD